MLLISGKFGTSISVSAFFDLINPFSRSSFCLPYLHIDCMISLTLDLVLVYQKMTLDNLRQVSSQHIVDEFTLV